VSLVPIISQMNPFHTILLCFFKLHFMIMREFTSLLAFHCPFFAEFLLTYEAREEEKTSPQLIQINLQTEYITWPKFR